MKRSSRDAKGNYVKEPIRKYAILWRRKSLGFLLLLTILFSFRGCFSTSDPSVPLTLNSAENAYIQMKLNLSQKILTHILENDSSSRDERVTAAQHLAEQEWLCYRDYQRAKALLRRADSLCIKRWATWQMLGLIERENGQYSNAYTAEELALKYAESEAEKSDSKVSLAQTIHDQCMSTIIGGKQPDSDLLNTAHMLLQNVLDEEPGQPAASELLLGISLMRHDGPTALKAWRYYFLIPSEDSAKNILAEPGRILGILLSRCQNKSLSLEEHLQLILALANSRFYIYAAMVANDPYYGNNDQVIKIQAVREVLLYTDFLKHIKIITEEYYRRIALDNGDEKSYKAKLEKECIQLWEQFSFPVKRSRYDQSLFIEELSKRFGTELRLGPNGNYRGFDIIMGHRVSDESHLVDQYGYQAKVHYIAVDFMVANGYSSWFWNGRQAIGGWGTDSAMVQVRKSYIPGAFGNWRLINDPQERKRREELLEKEIAKDDSLARVDPYAYLPGLTSRLQFNVNKNIFETLKSKGYRGAELCITFISEFLRLQIDHSIFAHEGRHTIDQLFFPMKWKYWNIFGSEEPEFRAKLSQVVFSSVPKFALATGGIFDRGAGQNNPHGKANARIMRIIVDWMNEHTAEIKGLDPSRPMLPQFDLLSDDQIRNLFRSADPLAEETKIKVKLL